MTKGLGNAEAVQGTSKLLPFVRLYSFLGIVTTAKIAQLQIEIKLKEGKCKS